MAFSSIRRPAVPACSGVASLKRSKARRLTYFGGDVHESDRTLREGSFGAAMSQPLRARLRSLLSLRDALADTSQQHLA
jgi:hypothetical protein